MPDKTLQNRIEKELVSWITPTPFAIVSALA